MAQSLNSSLIRVGIAPDVYNFEACIDADCGECGVASSLPVLIYVARK